MKRRLLSMLSLLAMMAGLPQVQAATAEAGAARNGMVVAFYGDSTIRGYRTHSGEQVRITMPDAFAAALGPHSGYRTLNEGVDSSRIEHLMTGTDGKHPRWETYIKTARVDIVITNHASKNGNPVSQYENDLRRMVRLARDSGKTVILMTPNPIAEGGLEDYVEAMRRVAMLERVPLIDTFRYLNDYMQDTGQRLSDIVPDGYHPSEEAYVLIGKHAARVFRQIMAKRGGPKRK